MNNNIHPLHVIQLSGHKNTESLNQYHVASDNQQRTMSNILNKSEQATDFTISSHALSSSSGKNSSSLIPNRGREKMISTQETGIRIQPTVRDRSPLKKEIHLTSN